MRVGPVLVLAAALAGCASSPPTQFYALATRPGTGQPVAAGDPPVGVTEVELPVHLRRQALVYRRSGNALDVRGTQRWAGPLDEMMRRTLAFNLAGRLGEGDVVLPGEPEPDGGMRYVLVFVETFSPGPDGAVTLAGRWTLLGPDRRTLHTRETTIRVAADSPAAGHVVAAMSKVLGSLAAEIAGELAAP